MDANGRRDERAPLVPTFAPGDLLFMSKDSDKSGMGELLAIEDDIIASKKRSYYKRRALRLFLSTLILFPVLMAYLGLGIGRGLNGTVDYIIIEMLLLPGIFAVAFAITYYRMGRKADRLHLYENGVVMYGSKRIPGFFAWTFWKHYRWIQHSTLGKVLVVGDRPSPSGLLLEFDDMFHVTIVPSMAGFDDVLRAVRRDLREWNG